MCVCVIVCCSYMETTKNKGVRPTGGVETQNEWLEKDSRIYN